MPSLGSVETTQLIILILYLIGLVGIGLLAAQVKSTMEEYFLADRDLGAWVSGISSAASSESGWVTLGAVGMGYAMGMSAVWFIPGCLLGYLVNWYLIAPRLRRISSNRGQITIPDFLEDRTQDRDRIVRIVAVLIIFVAMAAYVGAQFKAAGKMFESLFFQDVDSGSEIGIILGSAVVLLYTFIGGFRAVSWTDLVQGIIMVFGLLVFPLFIIFDMGAGTFVDKLKKQETRSWVKYDLRGVAEASSEHPMNKEGVRFDPLVDGSEQTIYVPRQAGEDREVKIVSESAEQKPPRETDKYYKINLTVKKDNPGTNSGTAVYRYHMSTNHPGGTIYEVKHMEKDDKLPMQSVPPPEQVETYAGPVQLKSGHTYFVGKKMRVVPGTIKAYNPASKKLTDHNIIHGKDDMVDPFGSLNNPERSEGDHEKNDGHIPMTATLGFILGMLGIGLGYPGMPHVLSRFMATRSDEKISQGRVISVLWGICAFYGAILVGMVGRIKLAPGQVTDQEFVFPLLATEMLHPILSGVLVSAILSAIMSTSDSMIIVATSGVTRDVYEKILRPDADEKNIVWLSRFTVIILGALGVVAAIFNPQLIFWFVLMAWALLGAAFGPPMILGVFWRGLTRFGVLSGMIIGSLTVVVWVLVPDVSEYVFGYQLYSLLPGFLLSFVATYVVSLVEGLFIGVPENPEDLMAIEEGASDAPSSPGKENAKSDIAGGTDHSSSPSSESDQGDENRDGDGPDEDDTKIRGPGV